MLLSRRRTLRSGARPLSTYIVSILTIFLGPFANASQTTQLQFLFHFAAPVPMDTMVGVLTGFILTVNPSNKSSRLAHGCSTRDGLLPKHVSYWSQW